MLTQFHYDVARAELNFAMEYLRDYRQFSMTGYRTEPNSKQQSHTLEGAVQALMDWLDACQAGIATVEDWREAVNASIENGFAVRDFVWQRIELERRGA